MLSTTSWRAVAAAALLALTGTLVAGLLVAPWAVEQVIPPGTRQLDDSLRAAVLGLSVVVSSPVRLAAGALAALLARRFRGTDARRQALPSALLGVGAGWALYVAPLVLWNLAGGPALPSELWWELPRWLVEGSLGALAVPPGRARTRTRRPALSGDRGAASVEYAGVVFVAAALVVALAAARTGIGRSVVERICAALDAVCALVDRADGPDVVCPVFQSEHTNGYEVSAAYLGVRREDGDRLTVQSDGSAQVRLVQSATAGVDATAGKLAFRSGPSKTGAGGGTGGGAGAGGERGGGTGGGAGGGGGGEELGGAEVTAEASVRAGGDVALLFDFREADGGAVAAQDFVDHQRGALGQAADAVVSGRQLYAQGFHEARHSAQERWWDLTTRWGAGPTDEQRAAEDLAFRNGGADAVEVSLVAEAAATASGEVPGGGVEAGLSAEQRLTATVSLHDDGPGRPASTVTGALGGGASAGASWAPFGEGVTAAGGAGGAAAASGEWSTTFDSQGNPLELVVTTERASSAGGEGTATVESWSLDLTRPADRAAFDRAFTTSTVPVAGLSVTAPVPTLDREATARLAARLLTRSRHQELVYATSSGTDGAGGRASGDLELAGKVEGTGLQYDQQRTARTLVGATGQDLAAGEAVHPLAGCVSP
ncbi:hypothetical protein [Quadrisphaera sp. INWT6]|uniref:hypothetical protein n=1 Tax=Quadrisphaera sp. INWT6 TaxID=2596917 RepID=UPI0018925582|nr:hypothetical protein [Quadrisphaera sp. INWT6]MBF5080223.1 hypothetical protein [Quadrisphaera sp. INWT6]